MAESFTCQALDQVTVVSTFQKALRHHDSKAGTFGRIQSDKTMMDNEVAAALRTP